MPGTMSDRVEDGYRWLLGIPSVDGVILAAILIGCLVVAFYAYTVYNEHGPGAQSISSVIKKFDFNAQPLAVAMDASGAMYVKCYAAKLPVAVTGGGIALAGGTSFMHPHSDGADDKVKRPMGGVVAILSLITFFTMILVLVLQRAASNTVSVLAANFLRPSDSAFALKLPFYTSPSWGAGVAVRVMVAGNAGACGGLASYSAQGFARGGAGGAPPSAWDYRVVPDCGGTGVAQHVFQCSRCAFSSSSSLTMNLDWSCQALYIEAGALDAGGAVSTDLISPEITRGTSTVLLSTVQTYDGLYLNLINDTFGSKSKRGYALAAGVNPSLGTPQTTVAVTKATAGVSYYFKNATNPLTVNDTCSGTLCAGIWHPILVPNVTLTMNLNLNTLYTVETLSEKTTVTALIANIIGLTSIVGLFAQALRAYDKAHEKADDLLEKRRLSKRVAPAGTGVFALGALGVLAPTL